MATKTWPPGPVLADLEAVIAREGGFPTVGDPEEQVGILPAPMEVLRGRGRRNSRA